MDQAKASETAEAPAVVPGQVLSPVEKTIADKRAALALLRSEREEKIEKAATAPETQLAKLEREIREEQAIAEAEAKYGSEVDGGIGIVRMSRGIVILHKPSASLYQQHSDAGSQSTVALKKLVFPCRVYPDQNGLDAMIADEPYTLQHCGDMVTVLAGFTLQEFRKK